MKIFNFPRCLAFSRYAAIAVLWSLPLQFDSALGQNQPKPGAPSDDKILQNLDSISIEKLGELYSLYHRLEDKKKADLVLKEIAKRDIEAAVRMKRDAALSGPLAPTVEKINKLSTENRFAEAARELEKLKKEHFADAPFFPLEVELGENYAALGQFDKAQKIYERIAANPNFGGEEKQQAKTRLEKLGMARKIYQAYQLSKNGRYAEARKLAKQVLAENPDNAEAKAFYSELQVLEEIRDIYALVTRRKFDHARSEANALRKKYPNNKTVKRLLFDVDLSIKVAKAYDLANAGRFDEAIAAANKLARSYPNEKDVQQLLRDVNIGSEVTRVYQLAEGRNFQEAIQASRILLEKYPHEKDVRKLVHDMEVAFEIDKVNLLVNDRRPEKALGIVEELRQRWPDEVEVKITHARVQLASGQYIEAVGNLEAIQSKHFANSYFPGYELLGQGYTAIDLPTEAIAAYEEALKHKKLNPRERESTERALADVENSVASFIGNDVNVFSGIEGTGTKIESEYSHYFSPSVRIGVRGRADIISLSRARIIAQRTADFYRGYVFAGMKFANRRHGEVRLGVNSAGEAKAGATIGIERLASRQAEHRFEVDLNDDTDESLQAMALEATEDRIGASGAWRVARNLQFTYSGLIRSVSINDIDLGDGYELAAELERVLWFNPERADSISLSLNALYSQFSGDLWNPQQLRGIGARNATATINLGEQFYQPELFRVGPVLSGTYEISPSWLVHGRAGRYQDFAVSTEVDELSIDSDLRISDQTLLRAGLSYSSEGFGAASGGSTLSGYLSLMHFF